MKFNKLSLISLFILGLAAYSNPLLAVETGDRTAISIRAALSFDQIKTAAQSGDADAQYALGYMYYYGKSGAPKDPNEAKKWISKAAAQKQPQAEKALALMNRQPGGQSSPAQGYTSQANNEQKALEQQTPSVANQANSRGSKLADKTPNAAKESELRQSIENENKMTLVDTRNQNATPSKENRVAAIQAASEQSTAEQQTAVKEKTKDTVKQKAVSVTEKQSGNFTLQLLGSYHRDLVAKELKAKHLENKANIYQTTFNNKDWFVLLYGRYDSKMQANEAAKSLESKLDLKTWVKPTATIRTYKKLSD